LIDKFTDDEIASNVDAFSPPGRTK